MSGVDEGTAYKPCVCGCVYVYVCGASWVGLENMETLDAAGRGDLSGGMIKSLYLCAMFVPTHIYTHTVSTTPWPPEDWSLRVMYNKSTLKVPLTPNALVQPRSFVSDVCNSQMYGQNSGNHLLQRYNLCPNRNHINSS